MRPDTPADPSVLSSVVPVPSCALQPHAVPVSATRALPARVNVRGTGRRWDVVLDVRHRGQHSGWRFQGWSRRSRNPGGAGHHAPGAGKVSVLISLLRSWGECSPRSKWLSWWKDCTDSCGVVSFDQARLIRHNQILAANGIDPSGEFLCVALSILPFMHVAMQACRWTRRRSLAYDRPGHSFPPNLTCYRRASHPDSSLLSILLVVLLLSTLNAMHRTAARNTQSLLSPVFLFSSPGSRVCHQAGIVYHQPPHYTSLLPTLGMLTFPRVCLRACQPP